MMREIAIEVLEEGKLRGGQSSSFILKAYAIYMARVRLKKKYIKNI